MALFVLFAASAPRASAAITFQFSPEIDHVTVLSDAASDNIFIYCLDGNIAVGPNFTAAEATVLGVSCGSLRSLWVLGGSGNDTIQIGAVRSPSFSTALSGAIAVVPGAGDDTTYGSLDFGTFVEDPLGNNEIWGFAGDDVLIGGSGEDEINAGAGDNEIVGKGADDRLVGGDGEDEIDGGDGADDIFAYEGNDTLTGGAGDDLVYGYGGKDVIDGGAGKDALSGDNGDDIVRGGTHDDDLRGNDGNDQLRGDAGNDILQGGSGNDDLRGGAGADDLRGNNGRNTLRGDSGNDRLNLTGMVGGPNKFFGGTGTDRCRPRHALTTFSSCEILV